MSESFTGWGDMTYPLELTIYGKTINFPAGIYTTEEVVAFVKEAGFKDAYADAQGTIVIPDKLRPGSTIQFKQDTMSTPSNPGPQVIEAARELIKKYRSITLEEITRLETEHDFEHMCEKDTAVALRYWSVVYDNITADLTGFGSQATCTLCLAVEEDDEYTDDVRPDCSRCIYGQSKYHMDRSISCCSGENKATYEAIENARTPQELLKAYQDRADHIEGILTKFAGR